MIEAPIDLSDAQSFPELLQPQHHEEYQRYYYAHHPRLSLCFFFPKTKIRFYGSLRLKCSMEFDL